jgi:hypothetical protein
MRDERFSKTRIHALGLAVLCALAVGCAEDAEREAPDSGADTDTGTGDEGWESPFDGSVWGDDPGDDTDAEPVCECDDPACGIEYTCAPDVKECQCGTICDDAYYGAIGWGPYIERYRCYAPCGADVSCVREGDVCTDLSAYGAGSLCLPRITAESSGFDIKVVPEEQEGAIPDAAQVDVVLTVGGEENHLVMAFATAYPAQYGNPARIEVSFMQPVVSDYYLYLSILEEKWAPGTIALSEGGEALDGGTADPVSDFFATLYRVEDSTWVSGSAVSGTVELVETPEVTACTGPGCPKAVFGSLSLELVGIDAELAE